MNWLVFLFYSRPYESKDYFFVFGTGVEVPEADEIWFSTKSSFQVSYDMSNAQHFSSLSLPLHVSVFYVRGYI
jgi:hypothetical protein